MDDKLEEFDENTVTLPVARLRRWALILDSGELNPEYVRLIVSTEMHELLDAGAPQATTEPATKTTAGPNPWPWLGPATDDAEG